MADPENAKRIKKVLGDDQLGRKIKKQLKQPPENLINDLGHHNMGVDDADDLSSSSSDLDLETRFNNVKNEQRNKKRKNVKV